MKLVEDRKVCWQDQYEGWHVGVTFLRDGRPVRGGEGTLVRHKHTGELEMVNDHWLKDYPMEPIPEPGVETPGENPFPNHISEGFAEAIEKARAKGLLTGDEARKRNAEPGVKATYDIDWKKSGINMRDHDPYDEGSWDGEYHAEQKTLVPGSASPRATDMLGGRTHVLLEEELVKLHESLAKIKPVKPRLSDLYRETQHLCIGLLTKE